MSRSVADASGRGRYRDAVALLGGAQKKRARGAPAYSIYVNRPFGRRLAAGAHLLGLTPNAVSLISAAFTFSAIVLVAVRPPTVWLGLFITAFLVLGYAFDSADGQLARLRGGGTAAGEWLDHVLDCLGSLSRSAFPWSPPSRFLPASSTTSSRPGTPGPRRRRVQKAARRCGRCWAFPRTTGCFACHFCCWGGRRRFLLSTQFFLWPTSDTWLPLPSSGLAT